MSTDLTVLVAPIRPTAMKPIMVTLERELDPQDSSFANRQPRRAQEPHLLSPPPHTWKSRPRQTRHRPQRSLSCPPGPRQQRDAEQEKQSSDEDDDVPLGLLRSAPPARRSFDTRALYTPTFSTFSGELVKPPPPLFRPTTFWRKTEKSGVTGPSYSPGSHLVRRSTYIAAGLAFDNPIYDLSAPCVESRVGFIVIPAAELNLQ